MKTRTDFLSTDHNDVQCERCGEAYFHSRDIVTVKRAIAHLDVIILSILYSICLNPAAVASDKPISTSILK